MWRNNKIDVNKMFGSPLSKGVVSNPNQYHITYPHINYTRLSKLFFINSPKINCTHIHTPNSSNNFYL